MAVKTPVVVSSAGELQQVQAGDTLVIANNSTTNTQAAGDNSTKLATTAFVKLNSATGQQILQGAW